jgi:GMP synthase (glutamine-hydrolysing)
MPRLLVVEHDPDAPAGLLAGWAVHRGLTTATVRLHAADPLPDSASACDAAVVLGSEQTAYDDAVPWLAAELAYVERLLAADVPVLGICFGGQVLARVLGARLYRLTEPEVGLVQVASRSPCLAEGPWPSWHRDAFDLPPGAAELAVNKVSLQAFALGPHVGVQFHPEATRPILASWLAATDPPPGQDVTGPLFTDADSAWERASVNAGILFSAWLDGGLADG